MSVLPPEIADLTERGEPVARVLLLGVRGGSSRRAGAVMWVAADGTAWGSVTLGGCIEAWLVERAKETLSGRGPRRLEVAFGSEGLLDPHLSCSGTGEVLIERADFGDPCDPIVRMYDCIRTALEGGSSAVGVWRMDAPGGRRVVTEGIRPPGALPEIVRAAAGAMLAGEGVGVNVVRGADGEREVSEWLLERFTPPPVLLLFGAGPVAAPLSAMAAASGFRVVVIDGRPGSLPQERFPSAERVLTHPAFALESLPWRADTYAVVVSHAPADEVPVILHALREGAAYVGFVGSRERGGRVLRYLLESGATAEELDHVRVPVGLDLGGETPGEIALSIAAELVAVRRGRAGGALTRARVPRLQAGWRSA